MIALKWITLALALVSVGISINNFLKQKRWRDKEEERIFGCRDPEKLPAADVAPVVFCRNCAAHNSCAAERNFLSEGITEPFCCRRNLKTNTQEVKK